MFLVNTRYQRVYDIYYVYIIAILSSVFLPFSICVNFSLYVCVSVCLSVCLSLSLSLSVSLSPSLSVFKWPVSLSLSIIVCPSLFVCQRLSVCLPILSLSLFETHTRSHTQTDIRIYVPTQSDNPTYFLSHK